LLHSAYSKSGGLWTGPNPAHGVQKFQEQSRDRFLSADELGRFLAALDDLATPASARDYFTLLLLTGARRNNVRSMRWDDLDLAAATWRIPAEQSKNATPMILPLAPEAVALLEKRKANVKGEFVFPSIGLRVKSKSGHLDNHYAAWCDVLERAKIDNLHLHDLRRTLGSWLAIGGQSMPVIAKALGHRNTATTAIYARLSIDPVRQGVNAATAAMLNAGKDGGK
jgi:integrase